MLWTPFGLVKCIIPQCFILEKILRIHQNVQITCTPAKPWNSCSLADLALDQVKSVVDQHTGFHNRSLSAINSIILEKIVKIWKISRMSRTPVKRSNSRSLSDLAPDQVKSVVDQYTGLHDASLECKKKHYQSLVNHYYDLATDFYEFGWGQSFHFAPRRRGESFKASLLRHQRFLADRLSLKPGMQVLDVGCGVGGPMGTLARYSGAGFVGINNNAYQIERAKLHTRDVQSLCRFIHGDYMQIPEGDDRYDAAIAIEAMPHAPDKRAAFREIFRVLRPGACFAGYEWCLTEDFDPRNAAHLRIKKDIERGNGLPDIAVTSEICTALRMAGFELLEARDLAPESDPEMPWYRALQGRDLSLSSIPRTPLGRALTNLTLRVGERLRVFPEGSSAVSTLLNRGADALVEGGESGIFTPMYFFMARKPLRPGD